MVTHRGSVRPNSISCPDAVREVYQRVNAAVTDTDPAPWFNVSPGQIVMFSDGDEAGYVYRAKLRDRSTLVFQAGLLSGAVRAHFSDGIASRDVPGWAWQSTERNGHAWSEGRLPLEVFLPEEWQRWSCHSIFLDCDAFKAWLDGQPLDDPAGLPELPPPHDAHAKPERVKKRLPTDIPFVTLSEALTWIAFGFALDSNDLDRAISGNAFDDTDPQAALADAIARLAVWASGGKIAARGKYVENHSTDENKVLTATIDPVRFEDFAQFNSACDGLRYGTGLTWNHVGCALDYSSQDRRDAFRSVKVNRADLLKLFPDRDDSAKSQLAPVKLPDSADVFARTAYLSRDQQALFRGDQLPYNGEAERLANGQAAKLAHVEALARFLRSGGVCQEFLSETHHYHGGSAHGLALHLALAFSDGGGSLTGAQCWAMLMHWRGTPDEHWPGMAQPTPDAMDDAAYSTDEIKDWIQANPQYTNQKTARTEFMKQPRAVGLSAAFESVWQDLKKAPRGRPPKNK